VSSKWYVGMRKLSRNYKVTI